MRALGSVYVSHRVLIKPKATQILVLILLSFTQVKVRSKPIIKLFCEIEIRPSVGQPSTGMESVTPPIWVFCGDSMGWDDEVESFIPVCDSAGELEWPIQPKRGASWLTAQGWTFHPRRM